MLAVRWVVCRAILIGVSNAGGDAGRGVPGRRGKEMYDVFGEEGIQVENGRGRCPRGRSASGFGVAGPGPARQFQQ